MTINEKHLRQSWFSDFIFFFFVKLLQNFTFNSVCHLLFFVIDCEIWWNFSSLSLWCIMGLWNFLGRLILMTRTDLHSSVSLFQTLVCCLHGQLPSKGASWLKTDLKLVCVTFHPKKEIRSCFNMQSYGSYGSEQCSWSCRGVDYVSSRLIRDQSQFVRSPSFLQRRKQSEREGKSTLF